ncbi:unnamed protein product, partial [Staurois parvus]
ECVQVLQQTGADQSKKDKCGRTPLHYASVNCHFHCIEVLVNSGANVNEADVWGRTSLHYAAASNIDRKRRIILGRGHEDTEEADLSSPVKEKEAAKCLQYLLESKADPSICDKAGYSAIHYAAAYGHREGLEYLLKRTEDITDVANPPTTKSPLHLAAYNGHHQALEILLNTYADVDNKDEKGRTPLDLASFKGHTECV